MYPTTLGQTLWRGTRTRRPADAWFATCDVASQVAKRARAPTSCRGFGRRKRARHWLAFLRGKIRGFGVAAAAAKAPWLLARECSRESRRARERLEDDAIPLGESLERCELIRISVGAQLERQADCEETHRRVAADAESPAEVEVAFRVHGPGRHRDSKRGRYSPQRDARARD